VILIDQTRGEIARGLDRWNAVAEAAVPRTRPVVLTATATVLGSDIV
jgi:multidrug efflux pump subunit AcrB